MPAPPYRQRVNPRRHSRPSKTLRQKRLGWAVRCSAVAVLLVCCLFAWACLARAYAPVSNTDRTRFDAIIVLGNPADGDGNPNAAQLARVTEAVHEYERGVAPKLIMTGAAVANQFVEARVMARTAEAQGIPASAILVEDQARDTIQNACYSVRLMKARGWQSAEVVSSGPHLSRSALIFSHLPIEWSMHEAPTLAPESTADARYAVALETLKTVRYLAWARQTERCLP